MNSLQSNILNSGHQFVHTQMVSCEYIEQEVLFKVDLCRNPLFVLTNLSLKYIAQSKGINYTFGDKYRQHKHTLRYLDIFHNNLRPLTDCANDLL